MSRPLETIAEAMARMREQNEGLRQTVQELRAAIAALLDAEHDLGEPGLGKEARRVRYQRALDALKRIDRGPA